ncbi:MAG: MerR family transcriptional regulator [Pseudomonadota bacterium]
MAEQGKEAYRTISEVAKWLGTQAHVLRYWESKFEDVTPLKGSGGRRYYRDSDMLLLGGIKHLLHNEGMTIKEVKARIADEEADAIRLLSPELTHATDIDKPKTPNNVIAFTIDPLPVRLPKRDRSLADDQALLFPELGTDIDFDNKTPIPLTPQFLNPARPMQSFPSEDTPMLNLFDDLEDIATAPIPLAPVQLQKLPKNPPLSQFAKTPGLLTDWFSLPRNKRANALGLQANVIMAALNKITGNTQNA